ncbi:MAG: hypothetical protein N4A35_06945 [Flavobacteriales bacterium]|nr:hypothetical protein [Flavobacteriales bacterium]
MKYCLIFSFMISFSFLAQEKTRRIPITTKDGTKALVEVDNRHKKIKTHSKYTYSWYKAKAILHTQGAYQGDLLHGIYQENYSSKQLKVKGEYRYGLKTGRWRYWDENGKLTKEEHWKKGTIVVPKAKTPKPPKVKPAPQPQQEKEHSKPLKKKLKEQKKEQQQATPTKQTTN